jgi:hypothetical protein
MNLTFIDFEMLTENQMQFKGIDWEAQTDRFDQAPNFEHEYIYWVENSAALVLATKYLQQQGYEFQINYDLRFDQPIFTTNFAGSWVNA